MDKLTIELKKFGVDVEGMITRLGGSESIYLSICRKFLEDTNYGLFLKAMEANDMNMAGVYIHTLKGVASNLGFTNLMLHSNSIIEDLKHYDYVFLHKKLQELTKEYNVLIELLSKDEK